MRTIYVNRKDNLLRLIDLYGGYTKLNLALGRKKTDATLNQIANEFKDSRTNQPRRMGDKVARDIELRLNLEEGWMDRTNPEDNNFELEKKDQDVDRVIIPPIMDGMGKFSENKNTLIVSRKFLEHELSSSEISKLRALFYMSNDMEPSFGSGSFLIIDTSITKFKGNGLYLIQQAEFRDVLRINQTMDGSFLLYYDNPKNRVNEELDSLESVSILGKVVFGWSPFKA